MIYDRYNNFVDQNIFVYEREIVETEGQKQEYLKLELSSDRLHSFYYKFKNISIPKEIVVTIYDEDTIINSFERDLRKKLIRILNEMPIKQIKFILSDNTLPEYNRLMHQLYWQHEQKTTISLKIDRNPISSEVRTWNLQTAAGKLEIPKEKLIWLPDQELIRTYGKIDDEIIKDVIKQKELIKDIYDFLREHYKLDEMTNFEKIYLFFKLLKQQLNLSNNRIDKIDGRLTLISEPPQYIENMYKFLLDPNTKQEEISNLLVYLLNNPFTKINATTIYGEINQTKTSWVGTVVNNRLYDCNLDMQYPFIDLNQQGYNTTISEIPSQIYPYIYEPDYLSIKDIKKIDSNIKKLKK